MVQELPLLSIQYKAEQSKNAPFLLKPWFFIIFFFFFFLWFSMYILCQLYILAITFFFSRLCEIKACIFVTHKLSHRDVLLDSLYNFFNTYIYIYIYNISAHQ